MTLRLWRMNKNRPQGSFPGVKPAPPRMALKMFGGDMTIEEFRNTNPLETHALLNPPFSMEVIQQVHCVYDINERDRTMRRDPVRRENPSTFVGDSRADEDRKRKKGESGALALKRGKPSSDPKNSLDKFLGIKRTALKSSSK
eukprot:jgi/Mesvir1/7771/Mv11714-RA.1